MLTEKMNNLLRHDPGTQFNLKYCSFRYQVKVFDHCAFIDK